MTETRRLAAILAAAKIRAGKIAAIAHQVHRAMRFTHGHDLPRLTRRLWSWRDEFAIESSTMKEEDNTSWREPMASMRVTPNLGSKLDR